MPSAARRLTATPTAIDALASLSGDVSIAVAFAVSSELLAAAQHVELLESELIAIVLLFAVIVSALPSIFLLAREQIVRLWHSVSGTARPEPGDDSDSEHGLSGGLSEHSLTAFVGVFVRTLQRVTLTTAVQLIASGVKAVDTSAAVRVLTLLSVATFFVFVDANASFGRLKAE